MLNIQSINYLPVPLPNVMMIGDFNFPEVDRAKFNSNDTQINMLQPFVKKIFGEQVTKKF